jgi:uncharacterized protein (TIGR02466 family)
MHEIKKIFPTLIYENKITNFKNKHEDYIKRAKQIRESNNKSHDGRWICNTYTTLYTENLLHDPLFRDLIFACGNEVKNLVDYMQTVAVDIICNEVWVNIAEPFAYQETHTHANSHFSLVYYVKVPKNSGDIVFRPQIDDMLTIGIHNFTEWNSSTYKIEPEEGKVVIFRSHTPHMVSINKSNEERVSIAMNFTVKEI